MNKLINLILFSLFFICTSSFSQDLKQEKMGYRIGSKVEDFKMKNVDEKIYSLSSIENNKGYIVIFTSNVCPFAVAYEDRIIDLHNKMAPMGYPVIAINSNDGENEIGDSFQAMQKRHSQKKFPFLYLKDASMEYANFGANKTPHVFLLDKEMIVRYIGSIDDSPREPEEVEEKYVELAISAIENGKTPDPETTKAIGCPIKAKGSNTGSRGNRGERGSKDKRKKRPSPEQIMKMMDKNGDEKITKEEAEGPLAKDFKEIDLNNDGYITKDELPKPKKDRRSRK